MRNVIYYEKAPEGCYFLYFDGCYTIIVNYEQLQHMKQLDLNIIEIKTVPGKIINK